jgi:hypothetical protein
VINQTKALKLVKIYSIICDSFEKDLKYTCERFSNNTKQDLTDWCALIMKPKKGSSTIIHNNYQNLDNEKTNP